MITYSEELSKVQLKAFARHIHAVAFPGQPYPKELKVFVASGFYLPDTPEVLKDLAPCIICPPSSKIELVRTLAHEFVHHHVGYSKPAHGPTFQRIHRWALENLRGSFKL